MPLRDSLDRHLPFDVGADDATGPPTGDCGCVPTFETAPGSDAALDTGAGTTPGAGVTLVLDAEHCPLRGDLTTPDCRATVVSALTGRDAESVRVRADGLDRRYVGESATLLLAAGRFAEHVRTHDAELACLAHRHPRRAAHRATGRAGPVARTAAETGLTECVRRLDPPDESDGFGPRLSPTVAGSWVRRDPPTDAELADVTDLPTGGVARVYDTPRATRRYHLSPDWFEFPPAATATLGAAYRVLAAGEVSGGDRAPGRAVRAVVDRDEPGIDVPPSRITAVLRRHTRGLGVLEPLFADPRVSDVYATAPVTEGTLRVVVDDEPMATNVGLTQSGAESLASRFRRTSGRAFSRAEPTLDATVTPETDARDRVRVAGVTDPASDGPAFAFRAHDREAWTLPGLIASGTLPADAAALLSVAVERAVSGLIAGTRGAGKTTTLGALLWELPAVTRTVVVEDTPELPVAALQREDRDVQALRTTTDDGPSVSPTDALRTALRLGEGALVVGEVRGEEASVLYEAMRVGAGGSTVLGTIHGEGGESVKERVVADLGVPESSFAETDLLVTCSVGDGASGGRDAAGASTPGRHVASIEEVQRTDDGVGFDPLFTRTGSGTASGDASDNPPIGLAATGRIERGNSRLVAGLTRPEESYADLLDLLSDREALLADLAETDRTRPADVVAAYRDRRRR
ncbi:ATPase, T2SS/T4P/T4SS family [Salinirubrum litoreum]|uniref:ATPase, T2SS/T4P/T4SS family n=1 Tax=Salinirubrum litoreum TaxID=1126234 RepID=A0ABD5RAN7_9EURY